MIINKSVTISPDTFFINGEKNSAKELITIKGKNIIINFNGAVLKGSNDVKFPDEFYGIGLKVVGENIEIKNLKVQGYQLGLFAFDVDGLKITNCEFSHNFRCNLNNQNNCPNGFSILGTNNLQIAGISLNKCKNIEISNSKIRQSQNGIIVNNCKGGSIYNNSITFNSNLGINLISSEDIKVMHNYLDWNIRKGNNQWDGAAVDASFVSQNNIIAFNSLTHSGKNKFGKNIAFQNEYLPSTTDSTESTITTNEITPLPNGQNIDIEKYKYRGVKYILMDEWGPYNFEYPNIWLREVKDDQYIFGIFGPEGNWKIVDGKGFTQTSRQSGAVPATVVATKDLNYQGNLQLDFEFIGVEFWDQFGNKNKRGKTFKFTFQSEVED